MRFPLLSKSLVVAMLIVAILVPLDMIRGTIAERQSYRQQAVDSIEQSYAGAQTLAGPVVVVPYRVEIATTTNDNNGVPHPTILHEDRRWLFFPKTLRAEGVAKTNQLHRGIHNVLVYELDAKLHTHFDFALPSEVADGKIVDVGQPMLSIGIDDVRGLIGSPSLQIDGKPATLMQGAGGKPFGAGLHGLLPAMQAGQSRTLDTELDLHLGGTERLAIAPVADDNRIVLSSTWPSPEFAGRFLPHDRTVTDKGFNALWEISSLAANTQSAYSEAIAGKNVDSDLIQVGFVEPVNVYSMADRASKYGLLFVLLTFAGFLMFELVKQLRIHPVQYLLVGLALAIFFLLLLSLSEHWPFALSYLAASGACIGLQGFYLSFVLRSAARGIGFAAMLTALYGALYGLLGSEDNALLLGSLLLFAILAAIMVATRRIDWYAVARTATTSEPATDEAGQA